MPTASAKPKSPANGWTPARRLKQSQSIRSWRPWQSSTGPRTRAGKARASQNAAKPWTKNAGDKIMKTALKAQSRYLRAVQTYIEARKKIGQNELMESLRLLLLECGRNVTAQLAAALIIGEIEHKYGPRSKLRPPIFMNAAGK